MKSLLNGDQQLSPCPHSTEALSDAAPTDRGISCSLMSEDNTPLGQIIWRRFLKLLGEPPAWSWADLLVLEALKCNCLPLCRAGLFTAAAALIIHSDPPIVAALSKWISGELPSIKTHQTWYWAATIAISAALGNWLWSLVILFYQNCVQTRFAIPLSCLGICVAWSASSNPQFAPVAVFAGWMLFYCGVAARLWVPAAKTGVVHDRLSRSYFVDRLFECFNNPITKLRRIAVIGGWGTGKTMVLRLLRRTLEQSDHPKFGVAMINPWMLQSAEEIHAMIGQAFEEALGYRGFFQSPLKRWRWLAFLTGIKFGGATQLSFDLQRLFQGTSSSQEDHLVQRINFTLSSAKRVCVILVDDMERAEPDVVRRVFPLIDLLGRIENCFFVFGIDPIRVARAFDERDAGEDQTKGYLDKVFDLQINLPQARTRDLGIMTHDLIDQQQTPKLHSVWSELAPILPETPREVMHFVQDAVTKEVLFLSRYEAHEHDYLAFFKLRMLALEAPGMTDRIVPQLVESYRSNLDPTRFLWASDSVDDEKRLEALNKAWREVGTTVPFPSVKEQRLKMLFGQILDSNVDIPWACHHHMRLLVLNAKQRAALVTTWYDQAGKVSVVEMIGMAVPHQKFDDLDAIVSQLILSEVEKYEAIRRQLIVPVTKHRGAPLLDDAKSCLQKLIAHLSLTNFDASERSLYPQDYFKKWFEVIFGGRLKDDVIDLSELRSLETVHTLAAASLLSIHEVFDLVQRQPNAITYHHSMGDGRSDLDSDIQRLREKLQQRMYDELIAHIRSSDLASFQFSNHFGVRSLTQLYGNMEVWNPYADNLNALLSLRDELGENPRIATAMGEIANAFLVDLGIVAEKQGRADSLVVHTIKTHPDCISAIWQMGVTSPEREEYLKLRRTHTRTLIESTDIVSLDQFDTAFPEVCDSRQPSLATSGGVTGEGQHQP